MKSCENGSGPSHPDYHTVLVLGGALVIAIARKEGTIREEWVVTDTGALLVLGLAQQGRFSDKKGLVGLTVWRDGLPPGMLVLPPFLYMVSGPKSAESLYLERRMASEGSRKKSGLA